MAFGFLNKHTPDNTPIVIPCFERPEYFQQCLETLSQCNRIGEFTVHFCFDSKKISFGEKHYPKTFEILSMCNDWNYSKKVVHHRSVNSESMNAIGSIGYVMTYGKYTKGFIYIEEDVVVSKCFLQYCLDALNFYNKNPYVSLVTGYNTESKECILGQKYQTMKNIGRFFLNKQMLNPDGLASIYKITPSPILLGVCSWWSRWKWIHENLEKFLHSSNAFSMDTLKNLRIPYEHPVVDKELKPNGRPKNHHGMGCLAVYNFLHGRYCLYPSVALANHVGYFGWHTRSTEGNCPHYINQWNIDNNYGKHFLKVNHKIVSENLNLSIEQLRKPDELYTR